MPETIFVSGLVLQEDGSPPPFGTMIELDCGDTLTREATVDSEGHYGFQIGSGNRMGRVMPDASDPFGKDPFDTTASSGTTVFSTMTSSSKTPLSVRLMRCELRAQHPGYRSTSVRMNPGEIYGYTKVKNILMLRLEKIQGTSVSATSLLAPKDARKSMERASKALGKNRLEEAEQLLKTSLQIYPKNAEALFLLGQVHLQQRRNEDARAGFNKAMEVDSLFVRPYIPLARLELSEQNWVNSARLTDRALQLDPISYPEAYLVNAMAHYNLENLDAAERSARKGQRLDLFNQYPMFYLVLANILSRRNDDPGSLEAMRQYLKIAPDTEDAPLVRSQKLDKTELTVTNKEIIQ
jgi:tetratricopeptide (TPR) repeat protein